MTERITYTIAEAAEVLGISESSYRRAIARKELPALPIGRRLVVPKIALDALCASAMPQLSSTGAR